MQTTSGNNSNIISTNHGYDDYSGQRQDYVAPSQPTTISLHSTAAVATTTATTTTTTTYIEIDAMGDLVVGSSCVEQHGVSGC